MNIRLMYEHGSEAIMATYADSRILSINPASTRITGDRFDEVAGKTTRG